MYCVVIGARGAQPPNGVQVGFNSLRSIILLHRLPVIVPLFDYFCDYIIITIIIIIICCCCYCVITFMQGIYNYMPETNYVSRVHSVAASCMYNLWHR
jgi:hypothetical protein